MNEEIKEILENLKFNVYETGNWEEPLGLSQEIWKLLLDYITNLQEENKHLDSVNCQLRKKINNDIYKSRIDKAIEYSNNCLENLKDQESYMCESIDVVSLLEIIHKNYIEILGDDNE